MNQVPLAPGLLAIEKPCFHLGKILFTWPVRAAKIGLQDNKGSSTDTSGLVPTNIDNQEVENCMMIGMNLNLLLTTGLLK